MDIEKIKKVIIKFIDVFILKGTDIDYSVTLREAPDSIILDMDIDVDVAKLLISHPNYDRNYTDKLYGLYDEIVELVPKNIGLKYSQFILYLSHTYVNDDFIHYQMEELVEDINKILPQYGYDEDVEIWGNIYLSPDESIYMKVEFGGSNQDSKFSKNDFNTIIDNLVYQTDNYPYIRDLINYDDYEFFND